MSGFKRRGGNYFIEDSAYKRPRMPLHEDMGYHQGYVGDQPHYPPPPPPPHYNYSSTYPPPPGGYQGYNPPDHSYDYGHEYPPPEQTHYDYSSQGYYDAQPGQDWGGWQGEGRGRGGRGRGRGGGRGRGEGGRGRGGRGRGRGGRGGGQREPAEENPWLSVMNAMGDTGDAVDESVDAAAAMGTDFTCSKRSAAKCLALLYPDNEFQQTLLIHNELGNCIGYQVQIGDRTFYGEGSTAKIAKGLAAKDALTYIKATGCDDLLPVCNEVEEMEKMEKIKAHQEQYGAKRGASTKRGRGPEKQTFKRQTVKDGGDKPKYVCPPPTLVNFQLLMQKYVGHNNEGELVQTFNPAGSGKVRTCVLIVQGHVFKGEGATDKIARDVAAKEAIVFFEKNPPQFVMKMKKKTSREPIYDREDPDDYINLLYCKAWKFAVELTKDHNPVYVRKQNLAFVLKIYGPDQNIDNAEVVAMASGAKIISTEYMSPDGFSINDCGGETLCIRAFRRYLVNQLTNLTKGYKETIFRRNPFGRIMMKEGYKFVFVTNCSPMGDCKNFDAQFYNALKNKEFFNVKNGGSEINNSNFRKANNQSGRAGFDLTKCGMLHQYRRMALDHVPDQCIVPEPEMMPFVSPIVAPSAKLAMRNVVGFQGGLLSNLIDNVYFPEFYVGRAFDEVAMPRALYGRLQGVKFPAGISVKTPEIHRLTWKPSRMADKTTIYSFAWCEGCHLDVIRADVGKVVEMLKPVDIKGISEEMLRAYDSREIKSASPSQFCSYNYYEAFTEVLKALEMKVDSYLKLKRSATTYQSGKQAVVNAFKQKGFGTWPKRIVIPNF